MLEGIKIKVRKYDKTTYMSLEQIILILYDDKDSINSESVDTYITDLIQRIKKLNEETD